MPTLRALAANLAFYLNTIVWGLVCAPLLIGPRSLTTRIVKGWARSSMWLIRWTAGIRWQVRGLEHLPRKDGRMEGFILASKHQSAWETFGLLPYLDDPAYVLKQELMYIPIYGWYAARADMIPVIRGNRSKALRKMTLAAKKAVSNGRQIIIFPEGTRRAVGEAPDYKIGVFHLYKSLQVPIVPVALNSGQFWPRRKFKRYPGTIMITILPPILPGLPNDEASARLQNDVEQETNRLVEAERARRASRSPSPTD